ncbi:RidA family protein [Specibacter sp. RAF43]|uniref:RidA family protein n=1 Tax=Specibacter sp. RAF43 TaxID=3233057 RepID=UPI003F9B8AF4
MSTKTPSPMAAAPVREAIHTVNAPPPAGTYSQAIKSGGLVYISGQTPRRPNGDRVLDEPFEVQAELVMQNLQAVAVAAGSSIGNAVQVTVFLKDPRNSAAFDAIYKKWVGNPAPSRTLVQSSLTIGELEVNAVLAVGP